MLTVFLWMCLLNFIAPGQEPQNRYFKEDDLTGADYIRLSADHTCVLTGREHMGIWVFETGRWERSSDDIRFLPKDKKKQPYSGTEVSLSPADIPRVQERPRSESCNPDRRDQAADRCGSKGAAVVRAFRD
jgi:hypothetical protein